MPVDHQEKISFDWEERQKWLDLPIPVAEYQERVARLQKEMGAQNIKGLLIYGGTSNPSNLQYITGFESAWGDTILWIPPAGDEFIFVTNAMLHGEPAHSRMHTHWIRDIRHVLHPHSAEKPKNIAEVVADIVKAKGYATGRIALCDDSRIPHYLVKPLETLLLAVDWVPGAPLLKKLRRLKSPAEIALFKRACDCTDSALNRGFDALRPGITEKELFMRMAQEAYSKGTEFFRASVMFGPYGSLKNVFNKPREYPLHEGEIVSIDMDCRIAAYRTDTHRNAMIGRPKDDLAVRLMETVLEAGLKVLEKTGPGAVIYDLQKIMYGVFEKAGLLEYDFTKVLFAHGCGLDVVEEPYFFWGNTAKLEPGMTFYLEPCLVKHGLGTACWESLIYITETGYENLSKARDKNW